MKIDLRLIPVFSLVFMIGYQIDDWLSMPLFKYYPNLGTFSWGWVRIPNGHNAIGWFGWMAWGLIAATIVTALYALIPKSVTDRMSWGWSWIVPICTAIFALYIVITGWWLHAPG
jgi:hypothetical protein